MLRLLFVGFGTVGQGLAELLVKNGRTFEQTFGSAFAVEGITGVTLESIAETRKTGRRFKLIASISLENGEVKASVSPQQIDLSHPLANVMDATNAVTITSEALGDVTIVGPGAGRKETGYAMFNDLVHIARKNAGGPSSLKKH
jgi:homoserine dehydrogenase